MYCLVPDQPFRSSSILKSSSEGPCSFIRLRSSLLNFWLGLGAGGLAKKKAPIGGDCRAYRIIVKGKSEIFIVHVNAWYVPFGFLYWLLCDKALMSAVSRARTVSEESHVGEICSREALGPASSWLAAGKYKMDSMFQTTNVIRNVEVIIIGDELMSSYPSTLILWLFCKSKTIVAVHAIHSNACS